MLGIEGDRIVFESRLETLRFDRSRVGAIVWLDAPKNVDAEPAATDEGANAPAVKATDEADGFAAFTEAGNPFDAATAERLLRTIYSSGNRQNPADAYRAFRGRDPQVQPMLKKRGLLADAATS